MVHFKATAFGVAVAMASSIALAQWEVTSLHIPGDSFGYANGIDGGVPVGHKGEAGFWIESTPEPFVSLQPATRRWGSECFDAHDGQQVGAVGFIPSFGGFLESHASLWNGSAESWVTLHPRTFGRNSHSTAVGIHGGQQVGWTSEPPEMDRAALWAGTADSWIALHPAGAQVSRANGVHDGVQVGFAYFGGQPHAGLWRGDPASWVDLHPVGASESGAYAADAGVQGGYVRIDGINHAALWRGTAASWESLGPGVIYAMHDGWQVGGEASQPVVWNGTAGSRELLPIPDGFATVVTADVWHDGQTLYVVGLAQAPPFHRESFVWTRPMSVCQADLDGDGELTIFDFLMFQNLFDAGDPAADFDGDGEFTIFDFLAFQNAFDAGCP